MPAASPLARLGKDLVVSDLAEAGTFRGAYGEAAAVRVVVGEVENLQELGRSRSNSNTALLEMRLADLPRVPGKNDTVEIGAEMWKISGPGRVDRATGLVACEAHRGMPL